MTSKFQNGFKIMKCFKPSFFSFLKISSTHVLLKTFAIWVMMIIFPCQVESSELFPSQMLPKLIDSNLLVVRGISQGFVNSNFSFVTENKQHWPESLKEFMRGFNEPFPFDKLFSEEIWKDYSEEEKKYGGKRNYPYRYQVYISMGMFLGAIISTFINVTIYLSERGELSPSRLRRRPCCRS